MNIARNKCDRNSYYAYLKSIEWRITRNKAIRHHGASCQRCGAKRKPYGLHVHHKTYERLGSELMTDLEVLCPLCHQNEHGAGRLLTTESVDSWNIGPDAAPRPKGREGKPGILAQIYESRQKVKQLQFKLAEAERELSELEAVKAKRQGAA